MPAQRITRRTALRATASATLASVFAGVGPDPDAAILALGETLEKRIAFEAHGGGLSEEALEAHLDGTRALVAQIEATPARTLAGVRTKAKALTWCHCGEEIEFADSPYTVTNRLAESIVADLLGA